MKLFLCYFLLKLLVTVESRRIPRGYDEFFLINVKEIVSGDSLVVYRVNKTDKPINIQLSQIDSPRLTESYGVAAKEHLEKLLGKNKNHRVGMAVKYSKSKDGRIYGRLYVGRRNINMKMVVDGYARCNKKTRCPWMYKLAMRRAQHKGLGIWKDKKSNFRLDGHKSKQNKTKTTTSLDGQSIPVNLARVVDGDTVYVIRKDSKDSSIIKVRMTGIDSPEMKQSFGPEAKNHLETLFSNLPMGTLSLLIQGKDKYKRTLGVVSNGPFDVNKKMVEDGYAWCYRHTDCPKSYQAAMKIAQEKRKGLFVQKDPLPPWDWRKQQN